MEVSLKVKKIISILFVWKVIMFTAFVTAFQFIPLAQQNKFLGGGRQNYLQLPALFAWANFDGEHYLSIAIFGYKGLEQAFFPLYPLLIFLLAHWFYAVSQLTSNIFPALFYSTFFGLFISHVSILISLFLLWDLIKIDFSEKITLLTIVLLMAFPTSFYFGAVYSEALYLLLSLACFYFARKKRWIFAGIFGLMASATRIFGILLLPALIIEIWQQKASIKRSFWILLIPLGLIAYIYYQFITVGDPLAFYHLQKIVGEQHQSTFTLLPQVYYRYIKILLTVSYKDPIYQTEVLEFITGILFFVLPLIGYFKKVRSSYIFYSLAGFLIPTFQGSFSSIPRYVLVFFPSFLVMAILMRGFKPLYKTVTIIVLAILLMIETMLYLRGYWVA